MSVASCPFGIQRMGFLGQTASASPVAWPTGAPQAPQAYHQHTEADARATVQRCRALGSRPGSGGGCRRGRRQSCRPCPPPGTSNSQGRRCQSSRGSGCIRALQCPELPILSSSPSAYSLTIPALACATACRLAASPKLTPFSQTPTAYVASTAAGIATRPGRPLPGRDFHPLDQRTLSRRTSTTTPGTEDSPAKRGTRGDSRE